MDITLLFKALVKRIKTINVSTNTLYPDPKRILRVRKSHVVHVKTKEVIKIISKLRDLILESETEYQSRSSINSDTLENMLDENAENIIKSCNQIIKEWKSVDYSEHNEQFRNHLKITWTLVESYLKAVCKIYSKHRTAEIRRKYDKQIYGKLAFNHSSNEIADSLEMDKLSLTENDSFLNFTCNKSKMKSEPQNYLNIQPEELQLLEMENEQLYHDLYHMEEEVKQIEGRVNEISELQNFFTENILEQDITTKNINHTIEGSVENVKDGNKYIRNTIQEDAVFRVEILFFLLILSFSLLFLDWYNE